MGQIIENAHPFTFEVLGNTYSKDRNRVYQNGRVVEGLQPFGFQPPTNTGPMMMAPSYPMQMWPQMNMQMGMMPTQMAPNMRAPMPMGAMSMQIPSYEVRDFKVFFGDQYIPDARWINFTDLGHGYGLSSSVFHSSVSTSDFVF